MRVVVALLLCGALASPAQAATSHPVRARHGMVVSVEATASRIGADVLAAGGNAVDAAVATAFALAVTHPAAGNIGGGGFLLYRPAAGDPLAYDFREAAPSGATATMFLRGGSYDKELHHNSHLSVGVPGSVAGLHLAWKEQGTGEDVVRVKGPVHGQADAAGTQVDRFLDERAFSGVRLGLKADGEGDGDAIVFPAISFW